jgi:hypothetical protein
VGGLLRSIRHRRTLFVIVLVALVSIFAARALIHHAADDAAPATAMELHQDGEHAVGLDAIAAAFAIALLSGLAFATPHPLPGSATRWSLGSQPPDEGLPPPRWRPGPPCRAQLQCFLT